jgi:hypothetical protein
MNKASSLPRKVDLAVNAHCENLARHYCDKFIIPPANKKQGRNMLFQGYFCKWLNVTLYIKLLSEHFTLPSALAELGRSTLTVGRRQVRTSTGVPATLTETFHAFLQPLHGIYETGQHLDYATSSFFLILSKSSLILHLQDDLPTSVLV